MADGLSVWTVSDGVPEFTVFGLLLPRKAGPSKGKRLERPKRGSPVAMKSGAANTAVPRRAALAVVANFMSAVMDSCGSEVR